MIKDDTNKPICIAAMETQTQRTDFGHSWGRQGVEGEGGMYGKTNTETSSCVKHIANGNLLHDSGNSKLGLGNNPERWDAEGGGRDVQLGGNTDKPMTNSC